MAERLNSFVQRARGGAQRCESGGPWLSECTCDSCASQSYGFSVDGDCRAAASDALLDPNVADDRLNGEPREGSVGAKVVFHPYELRRLNRPFNFFGEIFQLVKAGKAPTAAMTRSHLAPQRKPLAQGLDFAAPQQNVRTFRFF